MRIAILICACASIVAGCGEEPPRYEVQAPPARFVAPTVALVHYAPLADIRAMCIEMGVPEHINPLACADLRDGQCRLYLPYARDVGYATLGRLMEHEPAHCWGWTEAHED